MKNRYLFFKKLFPEYVILFGNKAIGIDRKLKKYLLNGDINYLIIDANNKIVKYEFKINNYKYYLMRIFIKEYLTKYLESYLI